jgi:hypothetical protein
MNPEPNNHRQSRLAVIVAILGAFLIVAALVQIMRHYTQPPPLNANRAAERAKALAEIRAADAEALNHAAVLDPEKGLVRLPIAVAVQLVEREWKNPAQARSNLLARVDKANPPPPPPKPSAFE